MPPSTEGKVGEEFSLKTSSVTDFSRATFPRGEGCLGKKSTKKSTRKSNEKSTKKSIRKARGIPREITRKTHEKEGKAMGARRPERDQAMKIWLESRGEMSVRELAEKLDVSEAMIRKWKSQDQWIMHLKKPRGAPKGSRNAKGHGAPKGNSNAKGHKGIAENRFAQTHGAYARPETENFSTEDWEKIDAAQLISGELAALVEKRIDLEKRIQDLEQQEQEKFDTGGMDVFNKNGDRKGSLVYWDTKNQRLETLENRLLRVNNQILKYTEAAYKNSHEKIRLDMERARLELEREKAMGIFHEENDGEIQEE